MGSLRLAAVVACLCPAIMTGCTATAATVSVSDVVGLMDAVAVAVPGTRILIAPGEYPGGLYFAGVHGTEEEPISVGGVDPQNPPIFTGGANAFHFAGASHLTLHDMVMRGAESNGLNIDDGGKFDTPAHHIVLRGLTVTDVGPKGNRDGIKLSGVDEFLIQDCTIERWGDGGSAIDMVGCHRGIIEDCVFRGRDGIGGTGPQTKGGTTQVVIRRNRFENAGGRAVNIGGSTGLQFFRPQPPPGYEAKDIVVEGNVLVGSLAPISFVGVDGAVVRFNTIYLPGRWALRILQETREPGFVPSRNGRFDSNIIIFRSDSWASGGVNIGEGTAPETFTFSGNLWYCLDRPDRSAPQLPTPETNGLVGIDPNLADPEGGDFSLLMGSPATGKGHTALPADSREPDPLPAKD